MFTDSNNSANNVTNRANINGINNTNTLFGSSSNLGTNLNKTNATVVSSNTDIFNTSQTIPPPITQSKPSVLSKLAKRLNIFKGTQGIFTTNDFPSKKSLSRLRKVHKPSAEFETRSSNEIKTLIIKSKPQKFHLINAEKVLNEKQWRVMPDLIPSERLLNDGASEGSDIDADEGVKSKVIDSHNLFAVTSNDNGYWTSPNLQKINDFSNIEFFIVGRKGYGQIAFDYPVDLSELHQQAQLHKRSLYETLFEDVIEIGDKFVKVYKDDKNKPIRGHGLNVPATITLEHIKPKKGDDITTFMKMLRNKLGMEFITYDPITYVWTFKVQHFSIWGLVDEEDEYLRELKRQKLNNETGLPGTYGMDDSVLDLKKKYLNQEISSHLAPRASTDILIDIDDETDQQPIRENYQYLKNLINVLPKDFNLNNLVDEKAYEPEVEPEKFDIIQPRPNLGVSEDWIVQLKLSNELNSSLAGYTKIKNLSIELVDDILFHEINRVSQTSNAKDTKAVQELSTEMKQDINTYKPLLSRLLDMCRFDKRTNSFFKVQYQPIVFRSFLADEIPLPNNSILELCSILFDTQHQGQDQTEVQVHINNINQKREFVLWLQKYNSKHLELLLNDSKDEFERILLYLQAGEVKRAVELALETGNSHLSVILTSVDSGYNGFQQVAKSQLEEYEQLQVPNNLINIYKFMAGEYNDEKLLWSIRLACKVYYSRANKTLADVIYEIINDTDKEDIVLNIIKCYYQKNTGTKVSYKLPIGIEWLLSGGTDDKISSEFGEYLETLGLWKQAVFIYSYIGNDATCEKLIQKVIRKNIKSDNLNDEEPFLTNILRIPINLIYESVGNDMDMNHNYWDACDAFITAKSWTQAHEVIVKKLGPQTVISQDGSQIQQLTLMMGKFPNNGEIIPSWQQGAGVFQKYFRVLPVIKDVSKLVIAVAKDIETLLNNIPQLDTDYLLTAKAALAVMTRDVGELAKQLPDCNYKILALPLAENEREYFACLE